MSETWLRGSSPIRTIGQQGTCPRRRSPWARQMSPRHLPARGLSSWGEAVEVVLSTSFLMSLLPLPEWAASPGTADHGVRPKDRDTLLDGSSWHTHTAGMVRKLLGVELKQNHLICLYLVCAE